MYRRIAFLLLWLSGIALISLKPISDYLLLETPGLEAMLSEVEAATSAGNLTQVQATQLLDEISQLRAGYARTTWDKGSLILGASLLLLAALCTVLRFRSYLVGGTIGLQVSSVPDAIYRPLVQTVTRIWDAVCETVTHVAIPTVVLIGMTLSEGLMKEFGWEATTPFVTLESIGVISSGSALLKVTLLDWVRLVEYALFANLLISTVWFSVRKTWFSGNEGV